LACIDGGQIFARGPKLTAHVEVSVELLSGIAKLAFYVELTFLKSKMIHFTSKKKKQKQNQNPLH